MWKKSAAVLACLLWLVSFYSFSSIKSSRAANPADLLEIRGISWEYQRISGTAAIADGEDAVNEIKELAAARKLTIIDLQEMNGYIAVDLLLSPEDDGSEIKALVQKVLEDKGSGGILYLEMVGTAPGRLSLKECQRLADEIYRCQGGRIHSGQRGDGIFSLHGYGKSAGDFLMIHGSPVNISLAAAYDDALEGTRFYLGMPLVRENY